jgi:hypothetical protein
MNKRIVLSITLALLAVIFVVSYIIFNSPKETTYEAFMNEILEGDSVKSIIIKDFENPEPKNHLLIKDKEPIKTIVEQPAEMKLKETDEYPDELYSMSLQTNKKDIVFIMGVNNVIRISGIDDGPKYYLVEGENTLFQILTEVIKNKLSKSLLD